MNKSYDNALESSEKKVSEEDLALINKYSRKQLNADEIFVFSAVLCDNEIDRDFERFTVDALNKLATLFVGKTAIKNHSMNCDDQSARTFKTEVIIDEEKTTCSGEPYAYLKAYCYIPRIKKYEGLIEEIESGMKKEISIGCSVEKSVCSICKTDSRHSACSHIKGRKYKGKLCYYELEEPTDAYEWSFVAVPAQRNAGIVKSFDIKEEKMQVMDIIKSIKQAQTELTLTQSQVEAVKNYIASLEELADNGREYRQMLESDTVKLFAFSSPEISNDCTQSICKSLSLSDLKQLNASLRKKSQGVCASQLTPLSKDSESINIRQFRF